MIPLLRKFWRRFWRDELFIRRWGRAVLAVLGGGAIQVGSVGWEIASQWSWREWVGRLALASLLGVALAITAGERNARPAPAPAPAPEPETKP